MSANHARRRVGTRLTRSPNSKSKDSTNGTDSRSPSGSKSPSSRLSQADDIPVPLSFDSEDEQGQILSPSSSISTSSSSLSSDNAEACTGIKPQSFPSPLQLKQAGNDFEASNSICNPSYASIHTPSRSAFSASVSSKRKASNNDLDPSSLRRSVRQRAEASPFRLDSTEAQRDSTLFVSQPPDLSKLGSSPTNRKDSLFMSLPASFHENNEAQYAPFFDLSMLSANSSASCFLPAGEIQSTHQATTTTPAQEAPFTAGTLDQSPAFDFLQYSDFIAPFPSTPPPAFLSFPKTPQFSGTFTIAPQAILATPSSSTSSSFYHNNIQSAHQQNQQTYRIGSNQQISQTPLNQPTRPLPRRARKSSVGSDTGSIIIKDVEDDDEEEEEEEGDNTAHPNDETEAENVQQAEPLEDERFALFASQVRRKAEALSLRSSQGPIGNQIHTATATPIRSHHPTHGVDVAPPSADVFGWSNDVASGNDMHGDQTQGTDIGAGAISATKVNPNQVQTYELPPMPSPLPPLPPQYRIENGTYTDQYSSFPLSDDFNMGVSPTKSDLKKPKRGHHNKDRGGKPPRPPNCFILYRSDKVEEIRAKQSLSTEKMQKDISKLVAELWRSEPQSIKDEYTRRANAAREEHLIKYPGYVYQPARKDKPLDEDVSPLKRSGSAKPRSMVNDLSKSAPAARTLHHNFAQHEDEDEMSEDDVRAQSPSPSKAPRARTAVKQSRIPVPKSTNKVNGSNMRKLEQQVPRTQTTMPVSTQKLPNSVRRPNVIAQNAETFAKHRGINQSKLTTGMQPISSSMSKVRSTPSSAQFYHTTNSAQTPSAPRYAQATAASMSKSMSQPTDGADLMSRTTPSHPQHQYAAYAHIQPPLPLPPTQNGNAGNAFEQMMNSTPSKQQKLVFPDLSPPNASPGRDNMAGCIAGENANRNVAKAPGGWSSHQRSQTSQAALSSGPSSTPSQKPSLRRPKTTPRESSPIADSGSIGIPDGFVIGGKLYPAENVEEAMKAYKASTSTTPSQCPMTRMASNHSTGSNGPVQELTMPALPFYSQQLPQMQYTSQPNQNYVIGIAPDGQQIPLLISQPQNVTSYSPWQSVPAFMPSSTQATPSTGLGYDFNQSIDPLQNFDYNALYTPNTANSNMSNMPRTGDLWYSHQNTMGQGADFSQYLISSDSFNNNGTSPTFFVNGADGQQQEYVLAGPSVEVTNATGFAPPQETVQWAATA